MARKAQMHWTIIHDSESEYVVFNLNDDTNCLIPKGNCKVLCSKYEEILRTSEGTNFKCRTLYKGASVC